MPWQAQLAPVNALIAYKDGVEQGGRMHVLLGQGCDSQQVETGRWRGNPGTHVVVEKGEMKVLGHRESGVFVPWPVRAMRVLDVKGVKVLVVGVTRGPVLFFQRH